MSRKIIGVTVGTPLPKPNFKQTDPTKGDYIRNKPDFEGLKSRVTGVEEALDTKQPLGDYALKEDLNVYVQDDEPVNAPDGTVWVDTDELGGNTSSGGVDEVARQGVAENKQSIAALSEEIAKLPTGGSGAAILDVTALPTDDINEDVFYRLLTGVFYYDGTPQADWTCYVVDTLPQEGEPVTTDMVHVLLYYAVDTGNVSGYIPSALSSMVGVPAGWYPVEALAQAFGLAWGGIIWGESEDPIDGANRLLLAYHIYQYKQEWYDLSEKVGWKGDGGEIFNSLINVASGYNSHAEGYETTASGNSSHAEGHSSHAEGNYSHAEGHSSHAEGYSSHAEGYSSHAEGGYSHAEGYETTASGDSSHAEGSYTIAASVDQHVQGRYNIEDASGKYAHIVGNGNYGNPSNAHTLDWDGNAWFAGGIELTSPNGTRYRFTVTDDGTLNASVVTE